MEKLLEQVLSTADPLLVQKYVTKYLPNDPQNLQRIYNQLSNYKPAPVTDRRHLRKGSLAVSVSKKPENGSPEKRRRKFSCGDTVETSIKKSKTVITFLKSKGMTVSQETTEQSLKVVEKQKQKVLKPLKTNPDSKFLKRGSIMSLCQKYELNKQFYENPPEGQQICSEGFDPEMAAFILKRKKLLKDIQQHKYGEIETEKKEQKYKSVQSAVKKRLNYDIAVNSILSSKKLNIKKDEPQFKSLLFNLGSKQKPQTIGIAGILNQIIKECSDIELKQRKIKKNQEINMFEQLQKKLDEEVQDYVNIDNLIRANAKETTVSDKLERYSLDYLTYIKEKPSIAKMSSHKRFLIQNELQIRESLKPL